MGLSCRRFIEERARTPQNRLEWMPSLKFMPSLRDWYLPTEYSGVWNVLLQKGLETLPDSLAGWELLGLFEEARKEKVHGNSKPLELVLMRIDALTDITEKLAPCFRAVTDAFTSSKITR